MPERKSRAKSRTASSNGGPVDKTEAVNKWVSCLGPTIYSVYEKKSARKGNYNPVTYPYAPRS
jgi:hypothetical protein